MHHTANENSPWAELNYWVVFTWIIP